MLNEINTVLVVDDEKMNIDIVLGLFEPLDDKFITIPALSGEKALKIVKQKKIDLILLDIMMPGMDGYEVCKILKSDESTKDIPIIFITAQNNDEAIMQAFNTGAVDYVMKPFRSVELLARVNTHLILSETMKKLEKLASYDSMTGIYNRRKFFELASSVCNSKDENIYSIMIDIDKFKNINDTYGHSFGDKVIILLAKTVKEHIPENFIFGRLGGEEFAIVAQSDSLKSVNDIMEKIRGVVELLEPINDEGSLVRFTISAGISKINSSDTIDSLLNRADFALYEAKETGRNKVCIKE